MIQHQFGYSSVIFEKMYYGEFVDSKECVLNLENTLGLYNAGIISDIESLIYEFFYVKDFDFNDLLPNHEVEARIILKKKNDQTVSHYSYHDIMNRVLPSELHINYTPIAVPEPFPSVLLDKDSLSGSALERTVKSLLQLEKKHILKCFICNAEIQKDDVDTRMMMGPFMMSLLDYIQFSSGLIDELKKNSNSANIIQWQFGNYIKKERWIPVKESLSIFHYFKSLLFELYQELLLLFGDIINKDNKRNSYYELYSTCFGDVPSEREIESYERAALLFQAEQIILLYDKTKALSLLGLIYSFYSKHRNDRQIQNAILRLENRMYWFQMQCFVELSMLDDWDYINRCLLEIKNSLIEQIKCEVNPRNVIHLLDELKRGLEDTGFLFLPGSKLVDLEFSFVRNLERWLEVQYGLYKNSVSEYLPVIDNRKSANMLTEVKSGYKASEMKNTVDNLLQYMSGTNREHDLIMVPSEYQHMIECFYYFIDNGGAPQSMDAVNCRLNIGVISYTLYVLYKLIYPNDLTKRNAWLLFICGLFQNLPSPEELSHNFSRRSEEFLKFYFAGDRKELLDYIRNH